MPRKPSPEQQRQAFEALAALDPCWAFPKIIAKARHPQTQLRCFNSTRRFRVIEGGNATGKTTYNLGEASLLLRNLHPTKKRKRPGKFIFMAGSRLQASQVIGKRLFYDSEIPGFEGKPLIPRGEIRKLREIEVGFRTPYHLEMVDGSEMTFAWAGTDATTDRVQGIHGVDGVFLDEDAGEEKLIDELVARMLKRIGDPENPWAGFLSWSATPTTGGSGLEKMRDFCKDAEKKPDDPFLSNFGRFIIQQGENPAVREEATELFSQFLSEDNRAIRIHGVKSNLDVLRVYPEWCEERHRRPAPFLLSPLDNLWLTLDPGWDHAFGMAIFAISAKNPEKYVCLRFWADRHTTTEQMIRQAAIWLDGRYLTGVICDPAAWRDQAGIGVLRIEQIQDAMDKFKIESLSGCMKGNNDRDVGIPLVEEMIDKDLVEVDAEPDATVNGCTLAFQQMLKYRKKVSQKGQVTGTAAIPDEFPDMVRYLATRRVVFQQNPRPCLMTGKSAEWLAQIDGEATPEPEISPQERLQREQLRNTFRMLDEMEVDGPMRRMETHTFF